MTELISEEQIVEYKEAFSIYDREGEGTILTKDLGNVMRSLGQNLTDEQLKQMIKEADPNKNGSIDFSEFLSLMARDMKDNDLEMKLITAFKVFEKKKKGKISSFELKHTMISLRNGLTEEEMDEILKDADVDGNGMIDYVEFVKTILSK